MDFRQIRYRLQFAYLTVLICILGTFAVGVRAVFAHSLNQQVIATLTALADGATTGMEQTSTGLEIDQDNIVPNLERHQQMVQWFDAQGNFLAQQGNLPFTVPFNPEYRFQRQLAPEIQAVTVSVRSPADHTILGYVRAMETLDGVNRTLHRLDLGLGGGIALALIVTSIGSMVLTHQVMGQIEASFQYLKQFTADASHEFRSPLTAIKSNASVALKYSEGIREGDRLKFESILNAASQIAHLTEDLLLLARGDANLGDPVYQTVHLSELLQELVQTYQAQADTKMIQLTTHICSNLYTAGDPKQLARLMTNIVDNALKYTPPQGSVEIIAEAKARRVLIHVNDTGIGIAPQDLDRVFERFWRADQSRTISNPGSGLGLAIAQSIAIHHRGHLKVKSQLHQGSCFTVSLPQFFPIVISTPPCNTK